LTFPSPDDACRASSSRWAIGGTRTISTPSHPKGVVVCIKYGDGSPCYVYAGAPGIRVHDARPSSGDVDAEHKWRPW
jgi:hypothetical protein